MFLCKGGTTQKLHVEVSPPKKIGAAGVEQLYSARATGCAGPTEDCGRRDGASDATAVRQPRSGAAPGDGPGSANFVGIRISNVRVL